MDESRVRGGRGAICILQIYRMFRKFLYTKHNRIAKWRAAHVCRAIGIADGRMIIIIYSPEGGTTQQKRLSAVAAIAPLDDNLHGARCKPPRILR